MKSNSASLMILLGALGAFFQKFSREPFVNRDVLIPITRINSVRGFKSKNQAGQCDSNFIEQCSSTSRNIIVKIAIDPREHCFEYECRPLVSLMNSKRPAIRNNVFKNLLKLQGQESKAPSQLLFLIFSLRNIALLCNCMLVVRDRKSPEDCTNRTHSLHPSRRSICTPWHEKEGHHTANDNEWINPELLRAQRETDRNFIGQHAHLLVSLKTMSLPAAGLIVHGGVA